MRSRGEGDRQASIGEAPNEPNSAKMAVWRRRVRFEDASERTQRPASAGLKGAQRSQRGSNGVRRSRTKPRGTLARPADPASCGRIVAFRSVRLSRVRRIVRASIHAGIGPVILDREAGLATASSPPRPTGWARSRKFRPAGHQGKDRVRMSLKHLCVASMLRLVARVSPASRSVRPARRRRAAASRRGARAAPGPGRLESPTPGPPWATGPASATRTTGATSGRWAGASASPGVPSPGSNLAFPPFSLAARQ